MAIGQSGQSLSFSTLRTEFVGGSSAISLGDLYRGGSNIRKKAGNNQAVNLAASLPTSGALDVSDFYDQAKGFKFTFATGSHTEPNASTLFGDDYAVNYPKEILIPANTILGADDTAEYGLEIDSGGVGTITITNNGSIIGSGGAGGGGGSANGGTGSNGSDGGDAIKAAVACTIVNNGSILAGGGGGSGGGGGGKGGNLSQQQQQQTTAQQGPFSISAASYTNEFMYTNYSTLNYSKARWGSTIVAQGNYTASSLTAGQYTYYKQPSGYGKYWRYATTDHEGNQVGYLWVHAIYRQYPSQQQQQTQVSGHNGGAGGAGGLGRGFQNQPGGDAGASGSAGSTGQAGNGGAGGNGGTGGGYGQAGGAGQNGATGTSSTTSGSSGGNDGSVGAAGNYIEGISNVTLTNNGTVAGGTE